MIWPRRDRKSRALVRIAYLIVTCIVVFGLYRNLYLLDHQLATEGSYKRTQNWTDDVSKPLLRSTSSVWGRERVDAGKGTTFEPADTLRRTLASWKGLTTAIVEFAPYHEEVWGSVLHSFKHLDANLSLYRPPYRFSFGRIVDSTTASLNIDPNSISDPQHALKRLARNELDVIVITSGDKYWVDNSTRQALVEAKDTMVVLFIHHAQSLLENLERETLHEVAGQGRLCLLGLSPHTTDMVKMTVENWSMADEKVAWDKTLNDTFVPVFPSVHTGAVEPSNHMRKPARIGIQGRIEYHRRDYKKIFKDFLHAIQGDPSAWGLAPVITTSKTVFQPSSEDSLSLNLIGEHVGGVQWPEELAEIVHVHSGLAYVEYYDLLRTMDLIVPAFVGTEYFVERASSSIPAAMMSRVPLLVNPAHLRAYSYLDAPAVRLHPGGMSIVEAIRMLRADQDPWVGEEDYEPAEMGTFWGHRRARRQRSRASRNWDEYLGSIYESNEAVWERVSAKLLRRRSVNGGMD